MKDVANDPKYGDLLNCWLRWGQGVGHLIKGDKHVRIAATTEEHLAEGDGQARRNIGSVAALDPVPPVFTAGILRAGGTGACGAEGSRAGVVTRGLEGERHVLRAPRVPAPRARAAGVRRMR